MMWDCLLLRGGEGAGVPFTRLVDCEDAILARLKVSAAPNLDPVQNHVCTIRRFRPWK